MSRQTFVWRDIFQSWVDSKTKCKKAVQIIIWKAPQGLPKRQGTRSPLRAYNKQYKKGRETTVSQRLINFVLYYVQTINLGAKIANIRLTAKEIVKKRDVSLSGGQWINHQPGAQAQFFVESPLPLAQCTSKGHGKAEAYHFKQPDRPHYPVGGHELSQRTAVVATTNIRLYGFAREKDITWAHLPIHSCRQQHRKTRCTLKMKYNTVTTRTSAKDHWG